MGGVGSGYRGGQIYFLTSSSGGSNYCYIQESCISSSSNREGDGYIQITKLKQFSLESTKSHQNKMHSLILFIKITILKPYK